MPLYHHDGRACAHGRAEGGGIELMRAAPLARRGRGAGRAVAFSGRAPARAARRAAAMAGARRRRRRRRAGTGRQLPPLVGERALGPYDIASTQVFHVTELSFALVNLKPAARPRARRAAPRWRRPRRCERMRLRTRGHGAARGKAVERYHGAEALTVRALPRESARPVRERRARVARAAQRALRPHAGQWTVRVYPHLDSERSC